MIWIVILISIYMTLLSFFGLNILTIFCGNQFFFGKPKDGSVSLIGKVMSNNRFYNNYISKLSEILKDSSFEGGVDGLMRIKLLCGAFGFGIGVVLKNPALSIVLFFGLFWTPNVYFKLAGVGYSKAIDDTIEAAMSIITNSYLQSEDLKSAILENIGRIDNPLKSVFREFLAETGFVDASITKAIFRMKLKVDNLYFGDWCDILVQCQDDRELKYVLPSIVSKLNSVKRIQVELDNMMFDIYKEYIIVVGIVVLNFPLMMLLNAEWGHILFHSAAGKLTTAFCSAVIFLVSYYVVSVNKSLIRM